MPDLLFELVSPRHAGRSPAVPVCVRAGVRRVLIPAPCPPAAAPKNSLQLPNSPFPFPSRNREWPAIQILAGVGNISKCTRLFCSPRDFN